MSVHEIVYRRVFPAPRERVWRCLTEPAELAQFWGPLDTTTPVGGIVVELRTGGRFESLMVGEHGTYQMIAISIRASGVHSVPSAGPRVLDACSSATDRLASLMTYEPGWSSER